MIDEYDDLVIGGIAIASREEKFVQDHLAQKMPCGVIGGIYRENYLLCHTCTESFFLGMIKNKYKWCKNNVSDDR